MSNDAARAARHARLRWLGAPLLLTGLLLAGWALFLSLGPGSGWNVGIGMLGAGLSLATFGANHDTAMALAFRAREGGLPDALRTELESELERDREDLIGLRASPRVGLVMPVIALGLQAWLCSRLIGVVL
jgi:hypothetical protein